MASLRTLAISSLLLLFLLGTTAQPAGAYSVLTHEQIIDLAWEDSIKPLLLQRYPNLTPAQLREAHAYAYGGCVIQDMGYYPLGKQNFSALLHYVRTADFIRALFRESKDANDVAFSIGALSHFLGDTIGHPEAVNVAVGKSFPELAAKFGPNVNYAEGPHQHVRAEFAFDINDIDKHRLAPQSYLDRIGFAVPVPLLTRAFYDTYGLDLAKVLHSSNPKLRGYRYSVRSLLPRVAYAEVLLHRKHLPPDLPSPALDQFSRDIATLAAANHWNTYHNNAGVGTHLLAAFIFFLPKVGALSDLSLRGPTPSAEQDYVNSLVHTLTVFRRTLANSTQNDGLANEDLDTGNIVYPGTYSLEDYTYVTLLHEVTRDPSSPVPFGIKRDVLAYFADLDKVVYLRRKPKLLAQVRADLPILQAISTKAAYPDTAFLPEPDEDKPPAAKASDPKGSTEPARNGAKQSTDSTGSRPAVPLSPPNIETPATILPPPQQ